MQLMSAAAVQIAVTSMVLATSTGRGAFAAVGVVVGNAAKQTK